MDNDIEYHVMVDDKKYGSYKLGDLIREIQNGAFDRNVMIWKDGMAEWEYGTEMPELMDHIPSCFALINNQNIGPFKPMELVRKINSGEYDAETMVWKRGMENWVKARELLQTLARIYFKYNKDIEAAECSKLAMGISNNANNQIRSRNTAPPNAKKVIIAVKTNSIANQLADILEPAGYYAAAIVNDGAEAVKIFKEKRNDIDLVFLDLKAPTDGITAITEIIKIDRNARIIVLSYPCQDTSFITEAVKCGAKSYIIVPLFEDAVLKKVTNVMSGAL